MSDVPASACGDWRCSGPCTGGGIATRVDKVAPFTYLQELVNLAWAELLKLPAANWCYHYSPVTFLLYLSHTLTPIASLWHPFSYHFIPSPLLYPYCTPQLAYLLHQAYLCIWYSTHNWNTLVRILIVN